VTVLAFFFVPISLASSIFGMNVQEINQTGLGISAFVITSAVMVLTTAALWFGWRAGRNWTMIFRGAKSHQGATGYQNILAEFADQAVTFKGARYRGRENRSDVMKLYLLMVGFMMGFRAVPEATKVFKESV
jgi:hypothetical protein